MTGWLRAVRRVAASAIGAALAGAPSLEPVFIRTGRWLRGRSRLLGTLYWFAQDHLLDRLRGSGRQFRALSVAGTDVLLDITDGTARLHYFYDEPYEPELARAIRDALRPGDVFLDVGANIGFFSALAARLVGDTGRVVAFEPHPQAAARLAGLIAVNGLSARVDLVQAAVGNATGIIRLFMTDDSVLSTTDPARSPLAGEYTFGRHVDVPQITLRSWLEAHPQMAARVRAIKIDVEGTEADVLEGAAAFLRLCPHAVLLCETVADSVADRLLRSAGFEVSALDVRRGTFGNYRYARPEASGSPATPPAP